MEAFRANPQRTGDSSLYLGVSQIHLTDQYKATGALMPSNLETEMQNVFSLQFSRKGCSFKDGQ